MAKFGWFWVKMIYVDLKSRLVSTKGIKILIKYNATCGRPGDVVMQSLNSNPLHSPG